MVVIFSRHVERSVSEVETSKEIFPLALLGQNDDYTFLSC